jgi:hypothetical protein
MCLRHATRYTTTGGDHVDRRPSSLVVSALGAGLKRNTWCWSAGIGGPARRCFFSGCRTDHVRHRRADGSSCCCEGGAGGRRHDRHRWCEGHGWGAQRWCEGHGWDACGWHDGHGWDACGWYDRDRRDTCRYDRCSGPRSFDCSSGARRPGGNGRPGTVEALVAAGLQRSGRRIRAQRCGSHTNAGAGNNGDCDSSKADHPRRLPRSCSEITATEICAAEM